MSTFQPTFLRTAGVVLDRPSLFKKPAFVEWLLSGKALTWHCGSRAGDCSDVIIHIDPSAEDLGFPEAIESSDQKAILEVVNAVLSSAMAVKDRGSPLPVPVRITNLQGPDSTPQNTSPMDSLFVSLTLPQSNLLEHPDLVRWAQERQGLMCIRDGNRLRELVVHVDPSLSGEGPESDMPDEVMEALFGAATRQHNVGQNHIAIRLMRDPLPFTIEMISKLRQAGALLSAISDSYGPDAMKRAMRCSGYSEDAFTFVGYGVAQGPDHTPQLLRDAHSLKESHGGIWEEHDQFSVDRWQEEVSNDDTRLGYWEWVANEIDLQQEQSSEPDDSFSP